jgi:hypothetical protein
MDFVIAIPSYNRAQKLKEWTLEMLQREGVPPQMITIFLASEAEKTVYEQTLVPGSYGQMVVGVPTISKQRQFICDYYPEGTCILSIDDDIKRLKWLKPRPLLPFVKEMFEITKAELCNLWGIYPVNNLFYCKDRIIKGKAYIIGAFHGFINKKDYVYPPNCGVEDRWLSLKRYVTDGAVIRYEGVCPDTVYYAKGGLSEYRKEHPDNKDQAFVVAQFPDECELKLKKNGRWDVYHRTIVSKILSLSTADVLSTEIQ